MTGVNVDLYLRLSDGRIEEALAGRETRLRAEAGRLGWNVRKVVIENDINPDGTLKPASAFKRRKIITPSGQTQMRVIRPGWRAIVDDIANGRTGALLAEDLDRACRDPRDLEDLIDACEARRASARSVSGSLTLTRGGTDTEITTARLMVTVKNAESRDKTRRVSEKRQVLAGQSYGGGRRPYGYRPADDTEKYHRTLVIVEDEAHVLIAAADEILDRDISLKALARDLRERRIPTVTGTSWTASTLRAILLKPAIAGLAIRWTEVEGEDGQIERVSAFVEAPWPAVIERDRWEQLRDKLTDPARRTNTSRANEPRWLVSTFARCGVCNNGTSVRVNGGKNRAHAYICEANAHMRRNAEAVDKYISYLVINHLSGPDAADYLKPPCSADRADAMALRAELRKLNKRKEQISKLWAAGDMDDAERLAASKEIKTRITEIETELANSPDAPDPLAEFRDRPAAVVWESLTIARRRAIVRVLFEDITILAAGRRGSGFDQNSVAVTWRSA